MERINSLISQCASLTARLGTDADGQGLAEYGLILALVAVVVVAALTLLGTNVTSVLNNVAGSL